MPAFHHHQLIVYRKAIEFLPIAAEIMPAIEPGYGFIRDQLARAATSIVFNIAEGSGEFSHAEKARFYRMARRSATESASILEALGAVGFRDGDRLDRGSSLLNEIVAMLTVMTKPATARSSTRTRQIAGAPEADVRNPQG